LPWHLRMIITIFLMVILVYVYAGFRFSAAIGRSFSVSVRSARIATFAFIFLLNLLPILILLYSGMGNIRDFFTFRDQLHWQDYVFLYPFWLGLIVLIEMVPYYLLIDIANLAIRIFKPSYLLPWLEWGSILKIILTVAIAGYVGIKACLDTNQIAVKQYAIPVENLPADFQNLNLVLFGDVQVDRYTQNDKLKKLESQLNETNADIFLFAGDLVTYGEDFIREGLNLLCRLKATTANISCLGDHDYWSNSQKISSGLRECGWDFLENQHRLISWNNHKILVTGIVYIYSRKISNERLDSLLASALDADLKILLVHQPARRVIDAAREHGYDLVLAGHTHGGQIVFRPLSFHLTPSMFENPHYSGYEDEDGIGVVITNGIGLTLAPLRYNSPAEISKIRLVNKTGK
jgi:predicted MPP superfamily phosphohydrolase